MTARRTGELPQTKFRTHPAGASDSKRFLFVLEVALVLGLASCPSKGLAQEAGTDSASQGPVLDDASEKAPTDPVLEPDDDRGGEDEQAEDAPEEAKLTQSEEKEVLASEELRPTAEASQEETPSPKAESKSPLGAPAPFPWAVGLPSQAEFEAFQKIKIAVATRSYKPWEEVGDTKNDWIRTTSGEWLKGAVKDLRDDDLKIDSDKFGLQTLSWGDISDLHSPNRFTYVLDDQTVFTGSAEMADGKLVVQTNSGPRVFDKGRLMTIVPESTREIQNWSFRLTFGMSASTGNSDVVDYSAYSRIRREDPFNRATIEYTGAYGLVSDEVNTNRHRGNGDWNIFISRVFYITPFSGELLYDRFQNIELRAIASTGVGFHAVDTSDVTLDLDLAAGYVSTKFISVEDSTDDEQKGGLVSPSLSLEWDISDDVEFELEWASALGIPHIQDSFHRGRSMLSVEITEILDFDVRADYSRQESPVTDEEGVTPKKDDLTVTVGIGLDID